ncbi:D-alanyl-D-alanine carboxypeptidase family protein [Peribacillus glennii]|uniref:serine-type D-Ala-D-Ala carboxypeptidase n=1 Tax=Peribacillus glennii TaxID=2303991 RepID=A0A372L7K0_9BACI|nr:D-alanyl-D-alanine carboxypeptidase family protein [Peribacillus glennii]RFU61243.1 D-alanyl-D-alanine carboxypeptidase [Peribacillus glennii]
MLRLGKILLGMSLLFGAAVPHAGAKANVAQPSITGEFGVAIDAVTGEILYNKNAMKQGYPASMTKVLSAIILAENLKDGEVVTASADAVSQDPSNQVFLLKKGEQLSKEDALKAMMIKSSNDVTYAVAEKIAGNTQAFAKLMNKKAKDIGAVHSNFVTPNGLHDDRHVTTPYDLALIAKEAMKVPSVLKAMGTKEDVIRTNKRKVRIVNNSKIHDNPLALGGKTGYTRKAQNTLVEIMEKDGKTVIAVVMKTTLAQEYNDIRIMGNFAFNKLNVKPIVKTNQAVDSMNLQGKDVSLLATQDYSLTFKKGEQPGYKTEIETFGLQNGCKAGEIIGNLNVIYEGKVIKQIPLKSDKDVMVPMKKEATKKEKDQTNASGIVIYSAGIPVALYIGLLILRNLRQRQYIK